MEALRRIAAGILILIVCLLAGCGGDDDDEELVVLDIKNLGQLTGSFQYAAWVEANNQVFLLDTFNTDIDGNIRFSRFSLIGSLETGDRIFITIEPTPDPEPFVPTNTEVLTGNIVGSSAVLLFPRIEDFEDARGFATVSGQGNRQLLTEFENLPDVSDRNFIYQGFLERNGVFTPLRRFNFNQVPVSDTALFDVTTAGYFLSIEPVQDFDPNRPYTIRPFFTVGNLQNIPFARQPLTRSSLTPDQPNFNFPHAVATVR